MNTDNTELERRLAWQQAAWAWDEAHRALDYWMTHDPIMGSPLEDDYRRALKKATLLTQRAESLTPDPF